MKTYGLIGFPLGHSFSGNYFTEKFASGKYGKCQYKNFEIEDLINIRTLIRNDESLEGLNVTIPHKVAIIDYLDYLSPEASAIGAVNVIKVIREKDKINLQGYNSDMYGFTESLKPLLNRPVRKALILGSGGAAKAASYALSELGISTIVVSRREGEGNIVYSQITEELLSGTGLVVNATPLGMFPDIDSAPPINYSLLRSQILFDMVYNPAETLFMKRGREAGCTVKGGHEMLILQAERSWDIWNSKDS